MNPWVIIYFVGAAQAALLALTLWRRPVNPQANQVLAAWVAIVAMDLAIKALYLAEPSAALFKPYRFVAVFPFFYASWFYLYVRALTTGRGLGLRDLLHFAGFVFALVYSLPLLMSSAAQTTGLFERFQAGLYSPWPRWFDPLLFAYALIYIAAALVRVHRYRALLRQRRSDADRLSLRWIGALALCQLVIWCIAATHWLVDLPWVNYLLIYGAVAAWVCVVGWFSLAQPPVAEASPAAGEATAEASPASDDDARFPAVQARLTQLMAEQALYREPALTIGQLAKRSGYPEYLVSAVINRRLGGNFWDYINRQRVDAARACLADVEDERTVLDIAYACGFTSKSTFNAAFKRQLGDTPSGYRRRMQAAAATPPARGGS